MRIALLGAVALSLAACSLPAGDKGSDCVRSAQCSSGLACVKGKCSTNLQSIADQSMAPDLGMDDAGGGAAGADAMSSPGDGAVAPGNDAALSGNDGG